jgi:hypothetical protein
MYTKTFCFFYVAAVENSAPNQHALAGMASLDMSLLSSCFNHHRRERVRKNISSARRRFYIPSPADLARSPQHHRVVVMKTCDEDEHVESESIFLTRK